MSYSDAATFSMIRVSAASRGSSEIGQSLPSLLLRVVIGAPDRLDRGHRHAFQLDRFAIAFILPIPYAVVNSFSPTGQSVWGPFGPHFICP
jgi:hypothetical protein